MRVPHVRTHRGQGQPPVPRGHDVRRVGQPRPRRLDRDHPRRARRRHQLHRHRRRVLGRRVRGDRGQGARGPARRRRARHQVPRPMGKDRNMAGGSRRWIMRECEDSLRRLGTDHIDLYQIHRPDPTSTSTRRSARCPTSCTRARSATSAARRSRRRRSSRRSGWPSGASRERFVCEQPPYSILVRGIEADVLPTCQRYGMGVIPWSPLAGGWLSGKWRQGGEPVTSSRAPASRTATTSTSPRTSASSTPPTRWRGSPTRRGCRSCTSRWRG